MKRTHELKVIPDYYDLAASGDKMFEIRKNDRCFQKGDKVILVCWREHHEPHEPYNKPRLGPYEITCVCDYMQHPGYVVLGLRKAALRGEGESNENR